MDLLTKVGALRYGNFPLSSGKISDYYFDSKELTLDPQGAKFVAEQLTAKLNELGIQYVGGTPYSGIPIVAHVCQYSQILGGQPIPAFYVREQPKGHGLNKLVEGKVPPPGVAVAMVDDVVTTGDSLLRAIGIAEEEGIKIGYVIALLDRNEGGREAVEAKGYKFWSLYTVHRNPRGDLNIVYNGS